MSKVQKGIRTEPLEERMEEMKTYTVGIIAVAMLLVGTGAGFGIAQMEGTCTDRPVLSFEDQELPQVAKSLAEDMQLESPIETGRLPSESNADSSIVEVGGNMYLARVDTDDP
jgi:hypothetical protein